LFTGRSLLAEEALSWGFFNRLWAPEALLPQSIALATEIAEGPTFAHAMTKKMLHAEWNMTVDAAIDAEAEAQAVCMETQDFHRAYYAFVAKQKPRFEGD
jgi:enoyl-CoA hydratase/carnithine racemase